MSDVLAIISKAQFEQIAKGQSPGTVVAFTRYASSHRTLESLTTGGSLYLVTVRPPDERLWLVAVLNHPTFDGSGWVSEGNTQPIVDVSSLRDKLTFENGKGITAKPGTLGMSLQTPRVLAESDVSLISTFTGTAGVIPATKATKPTKAGPQSAADARADPQDIALVEQLSLHVWRGLSVEDRATCVEQVTEKLKADFDFVAILDEGVPIAQYLHRQLGVRFHLIPGGRYVMGFSKAEDTRLRELIAECGDEDFEEILVDEGDGYVGQALPPHEVDIAPFLLAESNLPAEALSKLLGGDEDGIDNDCLEPEYVKQAHKQLVAWHLRLPSEAEWEYAARAGSGALFPGGVDELPEEPEWPRNSFGLENLGSLGELCQDDEIPLPNPMPVDGRPLTNGKLKKNIMRGGSAMCYPWQGPDWVMSLCAARSSLRYEEFFVAMRPAYQLFADEVGYSETAKTSRLAGGLVSIAVKVIAPNVDPVTQKIERIEPYTTEECIPTNMYGKAFGDLYDLTQVNLKAKEARGLVARVSTVLEAGFTAGSTIDLLPDVLRLLRDRRLHARGALATFIADRIVGRHERILPHLTPNKNEQECIQFVQSRSYDLVALLLEPDDEVVQGACLLAAIACEPNLGVSVLESRLESDPGGNLAGHLALALGALGARAGDPQKVCAQRALESQLEQNEDELLGGVAAIGLLLIAPKAPARASWVKQVSHVLRAPPDDEWAFAQGDLLALGVRSLRYLGEDDAAITYLLALTEELRAEAAKGEPLAITRASRVANELLILSFDYHPDEKFTAKSLTDVQRKVVEALSSAAFAPTARFHDFGLSLDAAERRAWLLGGAK